MDTSPRGLGAYRVTRKLGAGEQRGQLLGLFRDTKMNELVTQLQSAQGWLPQRHTYTFGMDCSIMMVQLRERIANSMSRTFFGWGSRSLYKEAINLGSA